MNRDGRHPSALILFFAFIVISSTGFNRTVVAKNNLPSPGVGLLITREDLPQLREKIKSGPPALMWAWVEKEIPKAYEKLEAIEYPTERILKYPKHSALSPVVDYLPLVAFHYLMTGSPQSAAVGKKALLGVSQYDRLGWFTWAGGAFPHIGTGQFGRVIATGYDWLYDAMSEEERAKVRDYMIRAAEDFYRINLAVPGCPMHHFRSHNQGNNQFASAILCALALRGYHADADRWLRAMIQTLSWTLTEHFGPMGQDLEPDLKGYWMISVDAITQAAVALRNCIGIDLTHHPHIRSLVDNAVTHLAPCAPVSYHGRAAQQDNAYDEKWDGYVWVQDKPACTPHTVSVSASFLFFAKEYRDGRALELWRATYLRRAGRIEQRFARMPHIGTMGAALSILWYPSDLQPTAITAPMAAFTDRIGMMRTGYERGDSFLLFNGGDLTLIAKNELLGTCLGLVWHHPQYQYAVAQNTVWTEGEDIQPSFKIVESWNRDGFKFLSAKASTSNVYYYRTAAQEESYKHFRELSRDILFVDDDYFVVLDRVEHESPRAHTWVWHTLNTDHRAGIEYSGRTARIIRPKAALLIHFAEPSEVAFDQTTQPLMPVWYFAWGDLGKALFARAGAEKPLQKRIKHCLSADGWKAYSFKGRTFGKSDGEMKQEIVEGPEAGTKAIRLSGFRKLPSLAHEEEIAVESGAYYRATLHYRKQNLQHYHNPSWMIGFVFLDAEGAVLNEPTYKDPTGPVVEDLNYDVFDLDWVESSRRFRVPDKARKMRAAFFCAQTPGRARGARKDVEPSLDIATVTVEREPDPVRKKRERFLTILVAEETEFLKETRFLAHNTPSVSTEKLPDGSITIVEADGFRDTIMSTDASIASKGKVTARSRLALVREARNGKVQRIFAARATRLAVERVIDMKASQPISISCSCDGPPENLGLVRIHDNTHLSLSLKRDEGLKASLEQNFTPGSYRLSIVKGKLVLRSAPEEIDPVLAANPKGIDAFKKGLSVWFEKLRAERDKYADRRNLAIGAKATASGVYEPRFGPEHIADNEVCDAYSDGTFLYGEPGIVTARLAGYGAGYDPLYGFDMPYRIKPTYWLAPHEQKNAWIQIDLGEERPVEMVRLLNTTNGGFNDRATIDFKVELLGARGKVVAQKNDHFGKPLPRPVQNPDPKYGLSFRFWYDPETPIPFGEGFKEIHFPNAPKARSVRVTITRYWGFGAGLNEVQVFGKR